MDKFLFTLARYKSLTDFLNDEYVTKTAWIPVLEDQKSICFCWTSCPRPPIKLLYRLQNISNTVTSNNYVLIVNESGQLRPFRFGISNNCCELCTNFRRFQAWYFNRSFWWGAHRATYSRSKLEPIFLGLRSSKKVEGFALNSSGCFEKQSKSGFTIDKHAWRYRALESGFALKQFDWGRWFGAPQISRVVLDPPLGEGPGSFIPSCSDATEFREMTKTN